MRLTNRQREILQYLIDNPDEDIMLEGTKAYYGTEITSVGTIYALLRICAISQDGYSDLRYNINETGRNLVNNENA